MAHGRGQRTVSILSLSPEIQLAIFEHLIPSSESTIRAVSLTCRQFRAVALPLTVRTFRHNGLVSTSIEHVREQDVYLARILRFLRYITVSRPELAQHVKNLSVGKLGWCEGDDGGNGPEGDDLDLCRRIVEQTFTSDDSEEWETWRSDWLAGLDKRSEDAQLALLLVACPNLEVLLVDELANPRTMQRVLQVAARRSIRMSPQDSAPPLLHRLREIYTESRKAKYGNQSWRQWVPALQIRTVRSFEGVMAHGSDWVAEELDRIPEASSDVHEIILRKACITEPVMRALARVPRALKSFEYTRGVYYIDDQEMMPGAMLEALLPHAGSLESLHANFEDHGAKIGDYDRLCMGRDLRKMTALRWLVVGMPALTGMRNPFTLDYDRMLEVPYEAEGAPTIVECLPENLEFLEVHSCGRQILTQAQELLDARAEGRFSRLKHLRLLFNKEEVSRDEIDLKYDTAVLRLDFCIQSADNRLYDLIQRAGSEVCACSRVFGDGSRERWLKYRGHDVGFATVNGGVYREPGRVTERRV